MKTWLLVLAAVTPAAALAQSAPAPAPTAPARNVSVNASIEADLKAASSAAAPLPGPGGGDAQAVLRALESSSGVSLPKKSAVPNSTAVGEEPLAAAPNSNPVAPASASASSSPAAASVPATPKRPVAGPKAAPTQPGSIAAAQTDVAAPASDGPAHPMPPAPPQPPAEAVGLPVAAEPLSARYKAVTPSQPVQANARAGIAQPAAAKANEFEVSDVDYNRLVFPAAVVQVTSPVGAPHISEPLYMSGNKHVLLRFSSSPRAIQTVFELEDGSVYELFLKPAPIRGVTREVGTDTSRRDKMRKQQSAEFAQAAEGAGFAGAGDAELLESFSMGRIPAAFDELTELPPEVHFERFWAKPIAAWTDSVTTRVEAWRLVGRPGLAATVAPPQFYRPGVRAVLLENDTVDGRTHPLLLLVIDHQDEE